MITRKVNFIIDGKVVQSIDVNKLSIDELDFVREGLACEYGTTYGAIQVSYTNEKIHEDVILVSNAIGVLKYIFKRNLKEKRLTLLN